MGDRDVLGDVGARRPLDAMVWPQHLVAIRQRDDLERRLAGMRGRKRDVSRRVPVLGQHDMGELRRDPIDDGHDLIAVLHRQAPSGQEAVLHVDDDQHGRVVDWDVARREGEPGRCEERRGQSAAQAANHLTTMEMCHGDLRDRASRSRPADDFMDVRCGKKQARPWAPAHLKPRVAHAGGIKLIMGDRRQRPSVRTRAWSGLKPVFHKEFFVGWGPGAAASLRLPLARTHACFLQISVSCFTFIFQSWH